MYRTGLYNENCIAWEDMAPANKTWPNWKKKFTKVIQDKRRLQRVAGTSYNAHSAMAETLQQDTIDALANLASATADDQNAVANLTNANSTLASQIKKLKRIQPNKKKSWMQ
eukprot:9829385-Ditylum_brightwellii.AAC.1